MLKDIEGTKATYLKVLQLLVEFKNVAKTIKTNLATPQTNFVKNLLINKIEYDNSLKEAKLALNISWKGKEDQIREWYGDVVRKDARFEEYLNLKATDFEIDKGIVEHLLRDIVLRNPVIGSFFEEEDIRWSEHEAVVKGMVDLEEGREISLTEVKKRMKIK